MCAPGIVAGELTSLQTNRSARHTFMTPPPCPSPAQRERLGEDVVCGMPHPPLAVPRKAGEDSINLLLRGQHFHGPWRKLALHQRGEAAVAGQQFLELAT